MKKLVSLAILIIFITGCSPNELKISNLNEQKEKNLKETNQIQAQIEDKKKNTPSFSKEIQTFINVCNKKESEEKNECLYSNIQYRIYEAKDNILLCNLIEKDSEPYAKCLWLFAMQYKDSKVCDKIKFLETFTNTFLKPEDCKIALNYKSKDSQWSLKSGDPYLTDPGPAYEGEALIEGWVVEEDYFGQPTKYFYLKDSSIQNLPQYFQDLEWRKYSLKIPQDDLIEEEVFKDLEKYNEKNPAIVKINFIRPRWEMTTEIDFVEIINP